MSLAKLTGFLLATNLLFIRDAAGGMLLAEDHVSRQTCCHDAVWPALARTLLERGQLSD